MAYSYQIHDRIGLCPREDWNRVCAGAEANFFMNPGFLAVVEKAFVGESRFWHLIFYNDQAAAVACASICTFDVDLFTVAGAYVKRAVRFARGFFPRLAKMKALFCGLPVSAGQSHLVMRPEADRDQILRMLDAILANLAKRERAWAIVLKEFDTAACERMKSLAAAGYRQAESPAGHLFRADFKDFDDYRAALTSHYRNDIRRSQRKFERAGLTLVQLRDAPAILRLYDDRLHQLYAAVVEKSELKLETLSSTFFRELVKQFPDQVSLTVILKEDRVIAFNWGFRDQRIFYFLFCGVDYTEQAESDLYFNLMFHQLDYALKCGTEWISFGQTADFFKARMGSQPRPLYFFAKGSGPVISSLVKNFSGLLFPRRAPTPHYSIFKTKRDAVPARESRPKIGPARQPEESVLGK